MMNGGKMQANADTERMDEATAEHLARLRAKRDKLQSEIDRIEAEQQDPLKAQADRLSNEWDARIKAYRDKHCRCHACNRQFDTERGLKVHQRSCPSFVRWKKAHYHWVKNGRQGPAPMLPFP